MQTTPQNSTTRPLYLAFELGGSYWKLGFAIEPAKPARFRSLKVCDAPTLVKQITREIADAKARFGLPRATPVKSVYEAGRDGFWLHHALLAMGVINLVIDPVSLPVDRRAKRPKTDRLDLQALLRCLIRHHQGERVWCLVNVPTVEVEDLRRLSRKRDRLVKEQTRHVNRIKGLLTQEGIRPKTVKAKHFERALTGYRRFDGSPLGKQLLADVRDELARLRLIQEQLKAIKGEQKALVSQAPQNEVVRQAQRLTELKGIGAVIALTLSSEFYGWRDFKNRRQVGALAGLTDSPWKSDGIDRQQGISKAGNRRVRSLAIQLAWGWLRWQQESALSRWFWDYVGSGKKRRKRVAIVALARKLLVALWHYLDHGLVPEGAAVKA